MTDTGSYVRTAAFKVRAARSELDLAMEAGDQDWADGTAALLREAEQRLEAARAERDAEAAAADEAGWAGQGFTTPYADTEAGP